MKSDSARAVIAALAGNLAITLIKLFAALLSGSAAMLAEAIHSGVDTANSVLMLYGLHRSRKPANQEHPFGYGHELYFWTLVVGMLIFAIGGGMSIVNGVGHVIDPVPPDATGWSYAVLAISFVFEGVSWVFGFRAFRKEQAGRGVVETIRKTKNPATFSVLLEDTAALIGLALAFIGIYLSVRLEAPWLDGAASIVIGVLLCLVALVMVRESKGLLVGEGVAKETLATLRDMICEEPAAERVSKLLTMYLGPDEIMLAMDVGFKEGASAAEVRQAIARIGQRIQERYPRIKHVFLDTASIGRLAPDEEFLG